MCNDCNKKEAPDVSGVSFLDPILAKIPKSNTEGN